MGAPVFAYQMFTPRNCGCVCIVDLNLSNAYRHTFSGYMYVYRQSILNVLYVYRHSFLVWAMGFGYKRLVRRCPSNNPQNL